MIQGLFVNTNVLIMVSCMFPILVSNRQLDLDQVLLISARTELQLSFLYSDFYRRGLRLSYCKRNFWIFLK